MTKKTSTKSAATKSAATKSTVQPAKPHVITSFALQTPEAVAAAYAPVAPRPKHKVAVTAGKKVGANIASKRVASKKAVAKKAAKSLPTRTITEVGQDALALIASHEEGREADAGFDAGEFSGPAHDRSLEKAMTALAEKSGFTYDQVQDEVMRLEHEDD